MPIIQTQVMVTARKEGRSVTHFLEGDPKRIESVSSAFLSVRWAHTPYLHRVVEYELLDIKAYPPVEVGKLGVPAVLPNEKKRGINITQSLCIQTVQSVKYH